jgi:hypothetical protein
MNAKSPMRLFTSGRLLDDASSWPVKVTLGFEQRLQAAHLATTIPDARRLQGFLLQEDVMGWLYMSSMRGHKTPKQYLDHQFTYEGKSFTCKVLDSAVVSMKRYYAAVEKVEKATGARSVVCVVCLVNFNRRDKEGMIFGYKDMDETMGPCKTDCPARILDLLTPTDSEYAVEWRAKCQRRLAKVLPQAGQTVVLKTRMQFSDKTTQSRFRVLERKVRGRKKLFFVGEGGGYYRLRNLRDIDFTIESSVQFS